MFEYPQPVLFRHCDPAGIVFYPRFFEMINDCVEAFFAQAIQWGFPTLLKDGGVPTAEIQTQFLKPVRHGEELVLRLWVTRVGRSSLGYRLEAWREDTHCFSAQATLVHVGPTGRPQPWPDDIRAKFHTYQEGTS